MQVGANPEGVKFLKRGSRLFVVSANEADGTVWRIDSTTNEVDRKIDVGNAPAGVVVADGVVWVAVQAP